MDDLVEDRQRATDHGTVRALTLARGAADAIWAGLRALISAATWSGVADVAVSLVAGTAFVAALVGGLVVSAVFSWIVGIGAATCSATLRLGASMARFDQRRIQRLAGERIDLAALPATSGYERRHDRSRAWMRSAAAWRLVAYQLARLPVAGAAALFVFGWWRLVAQLLGWWPQVSPRSFVRIGPILLAIACVLVWATVVRAASRLDLVLARWLLAPSHTGKLTAEVERLDAARSDALVAAESERRRIERNLHDGLQPSLVSLAVDLGLAEARFERDPQASRSLVAQAHRNAKVAIEDLRSIVRGIHPSVLDGRGLDAALSALVGSCPVPVDLRVDVAERADPVREAAAYYLVAEAVTNAQKHAGAKRIAIDVHRDEGQLCVAVEDDGHGGAQFEPGGGLAGLAARIHSLEGTFTLTSPTGGPTRVEAVIPCGR
ncbi:MAG: sensor histidine kinase [Acidimicrobiales bacterium]